jgi:hypothetical protein
LEPGEPGGQVRRLTERAIQSVTAGVDCRRLEAKLAMSLPQCERRESSCEMLPEMAAFLGTYNADGPNIESASRLAKESSRPYLPS